jgi:tetratricopeptide (TPR) repeat protein
MWRHGLFAFVLSGCMTPHVPGRLVERPGLLARAEAAIARNDWDDAAVLIGRFLRENPNDPWALQARYLLGTYYLKEHELAAAEREFTYVASHAGHARLARQARIRIGDVAVAATEFDRAAQLFERLLQNARQHGDGAELSFKLGLVCQRQGRWPEADVLYQRVREKYRGSPFAMRAAEQLAMPHHFSLQVGAFANKENAEGKREALLERGHEASVHEFQRHGRALYCVRVGTFDTRGKALEFRSRMTADPDLRISAVVP